MTLQTIPIGQGAVTASLIGQLAALQDLLATHDIPVSQYVTVPVIFTCESMAQVDGIAAVLGVRTEWRPGTRHGQGHYVAERHTGPNVSYKAIYFQPPAEDTDTRETPELAA